MLWESMDALEAYFSDIRMGSDDRPFETRWDYIVVEDVPYGPYGRNTVLGWWKGVRRENGTYDIIKLDKSPIAYADEVRNFTISG